MLTTSSNKVWCKLRQHWPPKLCSVQKAFLEKSETKLHVAENKPGGLVAILFGIMHSNWLCGIISHEKDPRWRTSRMEFAQGHRYTAHLTEISIKNHCSHYDIALITDSSLLFAEIIAFMTIRRSSVYVCILMVSLSWMQVFWGNHSFLNGYNCWRVQVFTLFMDRKLHRWKIQETKNEATFLGGLPANLTHWLEIPLSNKKIQQIYK